MVFPVHAGRTGPGGPSSGDGKEKYITKHIPGTCIYTGTKHYAPAKGKGKGKGKSVINIKTENAPGNRNSSG